MRRLDRLIVSDQIFVFETLDHVDFARQKLLQVIGRFLLFRHDLNGYIAFLTFRVRFLQTVFKNHRDL